MQADLASHPGFTAYRLCNGASSCQRIGSFICEMGLIPDLQGSYKNRRLASLLSFVPIANQTLAALRLILKLGQNTSTVAFVSLKFPCGGRKSENQN